MPRKDQKLEEKFSFTDLNFRGTKHSRKYQNFPVNFLLEQPKEAPTPFRMCKNHNFNHLTVNVESKMCKSKKNLVNFFLLFLCCVCVCVLILNRSKYLTNPFHRKKSFLFINYHHLSSSLTSSIFTEPFRLLFSTEKLILIFFSFFQFNKKKTRLSFPPIYAVKICSYKKVENHSRSIFAV